MSSDLGQPQPHYAAGWYPDPTRRFEFRYHDGFQWSDHVSIGGIQSRDPLASVTPAGASTIGFSPELPKGKALAALLCAIAALCVGWVPFVGLIGAIALIVAVVLGISSLRANRRGTASGHGMAVAALSIAPIAALAVGLGVWLSFIVAREVRDVIDVGDYRLAEQSCEVSDGQVRYTGSIENRDDRVHDYTLFVNFSSAGSDDSLYNSLTTVEDVAPGATRSWSVVRIVREEVACEVVSVTGLGSWFDDDGGSGD